MFDLADFSIKDMSDIGDALEQLELKAKNIDELSNLVVQYFFEHLIDKRKGEKSCVLVRFFMTYPYSSLDRILRQSVDKMLNGQPVHNDMNCLKLSATAGVPPEWNSTINSREHRVLPLQNEDMLKKNIMVHHFIHQVCNCLYTTASTALWGKGLFQMRRLYLDCLSLVHFRLAGWVPCV